MKLVVDALGAVFEFGSEPFVELRERIWIDVMTSAAAAGLEGLIFTFAPERTVHEGFPRRLQQAVTEAGGAVEFVRLECSDEEIERRLGNESRRASGKLQSVALYRELSDAGVFDSTAMPDPVVVVDTAATTPAEAASRVAACLARCRPQAPHAD